MEILDNPLFSFTTAIEVIMSLEEADELPHEIYVPTICALYRGLINAVRAASPGKSDAELELTDLVAQLPIMERLRKEYEEELTARLKAEAEAAKWFEQIATPERYPHLNSAC